MSRRSTGPESEAGLEGRKSRKNVEGLGEREMQEGGKETGRGDLEGMEG